MSKCGRKVFEASLLACQQIARGKLGGSPTLVDEYTGDSWQMRAGSSAVKSLDERVKEAVRNDHGVYVESFAYALGNGTDQITQVLCQLNADVRLDGVS